MLCLVTVQLKDMGAVKTEQISMAAFILLKK